jgi:hypothetical protein
MSSEQNKWADAVAKLIKLTQDGELKWRTALPAEAEVENQSALQGAIYVADQKSRLIRLYKLKVQVDREWERQFILRSSRQDVPLWVEVFMLELIDFQGNTLFTFPHVSGLKDLYVSVSYQVAGVEEFLDELLSSK